MLFEKIMKFPNLKLKKYCSSDIRVTNWKYKVLKVLQNIFELNLEFYIVIQSGSCWKRSSTFSSSSWHLLSFLYPNDRSITGVLVLKPPPLKVRIWEFIFRGLNCAKNSRNSASGVLIVPKIQTLMTWKTYQSLSGYQKFFACGGLLSYKNHIIYLEFGVRSHLIR